MLLKTLFWILIACDLAALGLFFLLGLAAAPSSHTSPLAVAAFMLAIPGLLLALAIALFLKGGSPLWRGVGLLIAAAPLLVVAVGKVITDRTMLRHQDADGNFTQFAAGPLQDLERAIVRGDAAAVATLAASADLAATGIGGNGVLVLALRQLEKQPAPPEVLRALLQAGADANGSGGELPLAVAIQVSRKAGTEPVRMLLDAGADPNRSSQYGDPAWFGATGVGVDQALLPLLLERGADVNATSADGKVALLHATLAQNWPAALLLLERGADWRKVRSLDGRDFRAMLEDNARVHGDQPGLSGLIGWLDAAAASPGTP